MNTSPARLTPRIAPWWRASRPRAIDRIAVPPPAARARRPSPSARQPLSIRSCPSPSRRCHRLRRWQPVPETTETDGDGDGWMDGDGPPSGDPARRTVWPLSVTGRGRTGRAGGHLSPRVVTWWSGRHPVVPMVPMVPVVPTGAAQQSAVRFDHTGGRYGHFADFVETVAYAFSCSVRICGQL